MKIRSLLLTALCAVAGMMSTVSASPSDVKFAPSDADLIVRVDGDRILRWPVFKKLRALPKFQSFDQQAQQELAKYEVSLDDLLATELCVFVDVDKFDPERPAVEVIARTKKPLSAKLFAFIDAVNAQHQGKVPFTRETIDGKEARVKSEPSASAALIALDDDLIQFSLNAAKPAALTRRPGTELSSIIESNSMISVAYRMDGEAAAALLKKCPPELHPFVNGLTAAAINVIDSGNSVRIKAELAYSNAESADGVRQMLSGMLKALLSEDAQTNPELAATLKRLEISGHGRKVIVTFSCDNEQAFELLSGLF